MLYQLDTQSDLCLYVHNLQYNSYTTLHQVYMLAPLLIPSMIKYSRIMILSYGKV